jgi:hypothetical protein
MANTSRAVFRTRIRLGLPTKDGAFAGLTVDTQIPVTAIIVGGLIAIGVVWIATRHQSAAPDALEKPTNIAAVRGVMTGA